MKDSFVNNMTKQDYPNCELHLIMCYNIQGLNSAKISELNLFLSQSQHTVKIISLTEHWLDKNSISLTNTLNNFILADYYIRNDGLRGGSCILVDKNTKYTLLKDFSKYYEDLVFECSAVEVTDFNAIVISIYSVPNYRTSKQFLARFEEMITTVQKRAKNKSVFITGDFNINILENCALSSRFREAIECGGFCLQFREPTRIDPFQNSKTCLDNIITHREYNVIYKLNIDLALSDHNAIFINLPKQTLSKTAVNYPKQFSKRIFTDEGVACFINNLEKNSNFNFNPNVNVNENYYYFLKEFLAAFNYTFPLKIFKSRPKSKPTVLNWVTQGIKVSSVRKRELHSEAKNSGDLRFLQYVKTYKKIFKTVVKKAKIMANSKYIEKSTNKSKAAWKVIHTERGHNNHKSNSEFTLRVNDKDVRNPLDMARVFNKYFVDTALNINVQKATVIGAHELVKQICKDKKISLCNLQETSKEEVSKIIISLKNKRSVGWDEVPINLIKASVNVISEPLALIINQCLSLGSFPDKLKFSQVYPIFKKGSRADIKNYRPVAVLSNFSKIFEKVINFRLVNYFESNRLFYNNQFGFRKNVGTLAALTHLVNDVSEALDGSWATAGIFCDLSRAFDCVDHNVLLQKLKDYGISGSCLSLISSYLFDRKQRTVISVNGTRHLSSWKYVKVGVPQGSILGPLFFLIYVNDLPIAMNRELILFADDTAAIIKSKSKAELSLSLVEVMNDMVNWFKINGLKLNIDKTQVVKFSARNENEQIIFPNLAHTYKYLGVHIDENINWKGHLEFIETRIRSISYVFTNLRDCVNINTLKIIYHAYVESILRYGLILWGQAPDIKTAFRLQKRIIRIMTNSHPRSSCRLHFKNLGILTLTGLYIYELLNYIHNTKINLPDSLKFKHKYNTRNETIFRLPKHRLTLFEKSPLYAGLKLYNKLPVNLKSMNTDQFKEKLKNELLDKAFYSLQEFYNSAFV